MFIEKLLHKRTKLIVWICLILLLSILPSEKLPQGNFDGVAGLDKLIHTFIYGVLSWLLCLNFFQNKSMPLKLAVLIIFSATMFGIIMEVFQYSFHTLGRSFEILDIVFNFFGAIIGFGLFILNKLKL